MNGQPQGSRSARGRVAAMAACSVVVAVVGGMLLAAPANADTISTNGCAAMAAPASASAPVSIATPSGAPAIGVLGCTVTVGAGSTSDSPTGTGTGTGTGTPTGTATDAAGTADPTSTAAGASGSAGHLAPSSTTASSAAASTALAELSLVRSSNTVYPVKDGYLDSVKFAIHAWSTAGSAVTVRGSAVLSKAGKSVETWLLDGSKSVIDWNGRVGRRIETGLYSLKVTAWSADGSSRTATAWIRVLGKHLEQRALTITSDVGARSMSADLPSSLLKAYATGQTITVRIRTIAAVRGPAKLVFTQNGISRGVALRNGIHVTRPLVVPAGFDHVTVTHDWAKGAAHLRSLKAIWTYWQLV